MTKKKITRALRTFLNKLTADEVRQLLANDGCIGLAAGTELADFDADDFRLACGPSNDRLTQQGFAPGIYVCLGGAMQEFEEEDLDPPAGMDDGDEDDYLDIYPERITEHAVREGRAMLLDAVEGWVDEFEEMIWQRQNSVV